MEQQQLTFMDAVKRALTVNYFNFEGRASRSEYWWFALFQCVLSWLIQIIVGTGTVGTTILCIIGLALFMPGLGLSVRRLHDINKSGWWVLLGFIPIVGWIIYIVWTCKPSDVTSNQYGPVPNCY